MTAPKTSPAEVVAVRAHRGTWLLYLDPGCGWVAYQAEATADGWSTMPGTGGILGVGDLDPARIIGGLLRVRRLPAESDPGEPPRLPCSARLPPARRGAV